jgi:hypothetical protein
MFMIATVHMVREGSSTSTIYVLRPAERSTYYIYHSSRYTVLYIAITIISVGIREEVVASVGSSFIMKFLKKYMI